MIGAYKFFRLVKFPGLNAGMPQTVDRPQELPKEVLPVGVQTTTPTIPPPDGSYMLPIQIDTKGALWVHVVGALGPVSGTLPADNIPGPTSPIDSASYTMVYNAAANTWGRARATSNYEIINAPINRGFANSQITVTNASQVFSAANINRQYLLIQNKDTLGNIWVVFNAAATTLLGIKIPVGGSYELNNVCSTDSINIIGDVASNSNVVIVTG